MADQIDYEKLSKDVFDTINCIRTNPAYFVPDLSAMRARFSGNTYTPADSDCAIYMEEGVSAVEEAISFLKIASSTHPLTRRPELDHTAKLLVDAIGPMGATSHGKEEFSVKSRVQQAFEQGAKHKIAENISLGFSSAKEIVLQFVIDDGKKLRQN